jgi:hypothetical protein
LFVKRSTTAAALAHPFGVDEFWLRLFNLRHPFGFGDALILSAFFSLMYLLNK